MGKTAAVMAAVVTAVSSLSVAAQSAAKGPVVGFMHAIHATQTIEKTLAFYTDVFGVRADVRPFANPNVPILTNSPGASLRVAMVRLPGEGFNFELTQFENVERRAAQPRVTDPGAPRLRLFVRDLDAVMAAARGAGAAIVTRGGAPVAVTSETGATRAVVLRDPDGFLVEAIQAPPGASGPAQIVGAALGLTTGEMNRSMAFWRTQLGFDVGAVPPFTRDRAVAELFGLEPGVERRTVTAVIPGSAVRIEFTEFRGVPGTPFDRRVPDPGASGMAIRVADIEGLLTRLKAGGVRVISRGGSLVEWSPTVRNVFVKDPDGLNIELVGEVTAR